MIDLRNIKNIILDLGGVILDLDVNRTIKAFHELGFPKLENSDIILSRYPFFLDFETGEIFTEEFLERIGEVSGNNASKEDITDAWNSMILGFQKVNIEVLLRLGRQYRLFLLSNTNAIHEKHYNEQLRKEHGIEDLDVLFEKVFYSHRMGLRKPNPEIFREVLKDVGLKPGECLYIDDTSQHTDSAATLGINTYHLVPPETLAEIM